MFEILSIAALTGIVGWLVHRRIVAESPSEEPIEAEQVPAEEVATKEVAAEEFPAKEVARSEWIMGGNARLLQVLRKRFGFITSFGLEPECLQEIHTYAIPGKFEDFPPKMIAVLGKLYDHGCAVGGEIMALIHHDRPLMVGESVYVAVIREGGSSTLRTIAFVAKACPDFEA